MNLKKYKINIVFFIFSLGLVFSFIFIEVVFFVNQNKKIALENSLNIAKRREASVLNFLKNSDLLLHSISSSNQNFNKELFLTLVQTQPQIMQLRYIDVNGYERIRVDRTKEKIVHLIKKDKLQNKSTRYYFKDSIKKPLNQVWFSDLDLNIENKKVEVPYVPTIRAILPIEKDGVFNGIIIVNYFMEDFLNNFFKNSTYDMILINGKGDILRHYNAKKNWSFYRGEKDPLFKEFPNSAQEILSKDFFVNDDFTSLKFNMPLNNNLILILKLKEEYLSNILKAHMYQSLILGFIIILLSLFLNLIVTKILKRTVLDLDKTKALNNKLQQLSSSLTEAQKVAQIGFWEINMQTQKLFWSDGIYDILCLKNQSIEEPSNKLLLSFVHEDDKEDVLNEYKESIKQKRECFIIYRIKTDCNSLRYIQGRAIHYYDDNGNHIRSVGSMNDKTDTVVAEKKIENYLEIIDKHVITSSTNVKGQIISASDAFCEISGYTREELVGENHKIVRHPDSHKKTFENMWYTISHDLVWKGELKNLKKDGSFYWVDIIIHPIYDEFGIKTGYTAIRQDITNKKLLEKIAITDALTDIFNRRHFNDIFPKIIDSAKRKNELLSFIIMDIDYFKQYNDTYGHQMGDEVLKKVSFSIKSMMRRADDACFRLGGEEFGVIYKADNKEDAINFAHKIKDSIEELKIIHEKNTTSKYITISVGLVCKHAADIKNVDTIYKEADDFLYQAKNAGRNRVISNYS